MAGELLSSRGFKVRRAVRGVACEHEPQRPTEQRTKQGGVALDAAAEVISDIGITWKHDHSGRRDADRQAVREELRRRTHLAGGVQEAFACDGAANLKNADYRRRCRTSGDRRS